MKVRDSGHEFALFVLGLSNLDYSKSDQYVLDDQKMVHRIARVLRLHADDRLVLFDRNIHLVVRITLIEKKRVVCAIQSMNNNKNISPYMTVWLPLLKREAFEQAIYSLVELGVNEIQFVHTAKEQRHWHGDKELQRVQNIMIAAAEQSKNFNMPIVHDPKTLDQLLAHKKADSYLSFDVEGEPLLEVANKLKTTDHEHYVLMVGPEGDLTESEKFQLQQSQFIFVYLTPTILRAQQALAVGVGALRSLL